MTDTPQDIEAAQRRIRELEAALDREARWAELYHDRWLLSHDRGNHSIDWQATNDYRHLIGGENGYIR
jgi:hypothetical protein